MKEIIENSLHKAITYNEYRTLVKELLAEGKSTGPNQSDSLLNYSMLNDKRMNRLDKTSKLSEETISNINKVQAAQTWLVLTESWCGDAAQTLPVINKIAELNPNIDLKIVLRDENEALMDEFLTNGGRSIPKLIAIDSNNEVVNSWGPRPSVATKMVNDYKSEHGQLDADFKKDLQIWYNKDKGVNTQEDILSLFN
ncbi:thioredoxin family protein [Flavobacteriaceae bacterium S356]|uniref:Thioredoxin family protein n=1 Tax=Asprobacillus argus TaxID=3076534 RepID=A0ABU3LGB9_9FLAO|nr:thioredoxin family protein [Flavobacteriaceae bacterium S356]